MCGCAIPEHRVRSGLGHESPPPRVPADEDIRTVSGTRWPYEIAQVGGLGIAPGANIGDGYAIFEATHGTAPKYADKDVINPGSVLLSGVMMFRFLGWGEAADMIEQGLERTIEQKKVTYDFERLMEGATKVKTSEFATCVIQNMEAAVMTAV